MHKNKRYHELQKREARLETDQVRIAQFCSSESIELRKGRLETAQLRVAIACLSETIEQWVTRLEIIRLRTFLNLDKQFILI